MVSHVQELITAQEELKNTLNVLMELTVLLVLHLRHFVHQVPLEMEILITIMYLFHVLSVMLQLIRL